MSRDGGREGAPERGGAERVSDLVSDFMKGPLSSGLSANQRAAAAWYAANGDIERAHTCGVYLRKARAEGADPVLCVYVDSHARMMDFYVNREVYLLRLANQGFSVSGIEFKLSKRPKAAPAGKAGRQTSQDGDADGKGPLPELDAAERAQVAELSREVPEELRGKVARAVEWSFRREKSETTRDAETGETKAPQGPKRDS